MPTSLPSSIASTPYAPILTNIITHQRERKAADDQAARQLKDKMIVEYRNQSEQHEKLTTEFVGMLQGGLETLIMSLIRHIPDNQPEDLISAFHENINSYILTHLNIYQRTVKKHKLNSRQRTDRFSGKAFTRYNENLQKDERELLALFEKLGDVHEKTFPSASTSSIVGSSDSAPQSTVAATTQPFSVTSTVKREYEHELESKEGIQAPEYDDSDHEMGGFSVTASSYENISRLPTMTKKRKVQYPNMV